MEITNVIILWVLFIYLIGAVVAFPIMIRKILWGMSDASDSTFDVGMLLLLTIFVAIGWPISVGVWLMGCIGWVLMPRKD
jgi:hypothetical protein